MLVRRYSGYDQQETVTFVFNGGHWIDVKISSSRSTSGVETFRCQALAQRKPTFSHIGPMGYSSGEMNRRMTEGQSSKNFGGIGDRTQWDGNEFKF